MPGYLQRSYCADFTCNLQHVRCRTQKTQHGQWFLSLLDGSGDANFFPLFLMSTQHVRDTKPGLLSLGIINHLLVVFLFIHIQHVQVDISISQVAVWPYMYWQTVAGGNQKATGGRITVLLAFTINQVHHLFFL